MSYRKLLSPIDINSVRVPNRVAVSAHSLGYGWTDPRDSGDRHIAYIARRAAGGAGLIVNEPIIPPAVGNSSEPCPLDYMRDRYCRLSDAVHKYGTVLIQQLIGVGANFRSETLGDLPLWSFDGSTTPEGQPTHRMTSSEIEETINGFAQTARVLIEEGVDGVELHAAHGYLIQQSFSPWANSRNDVWGQRLEFVRRLIVAVRNAIGPSAILGLRIAVDDFRPPSENGLGPDDLVAIAADLVGGGMIDYLNHSEGSKGDHYARSIGSWRHPHGEFLPLAAHLKASIGNRVPVIGVGRIVTPDVAEKALETGACDIVAMTRAQIADPDLVAKTRAGAAHSIRRCVGANQGCIDRFRVGLSVSCLVNPSAGQEYLLGDVRQADIARSVLVVGGGPAGLKAAEVAARRGHHVTIAEQSDHFGGRFSLAWRLEPARELKYSIDWLMNELKELEVDIIAGTEVDEAYIRAVRPDAVILATGAQPCTTLSLQSDGSIPLISPDDAMHLNYSSMDVLVLDRLGTTDVIFAAEQLQSSGANVVVAAPRPIVGEHIGATHLVETLPRLAKLGCELRPNSDLKSISKGTARIQDIHSEKSEARPFDAIVVGDAGLPRLELQPALETLRIDFSVIGDASAPRTALEAFREGAAAGRAL